jgi:hypothetical protein
MANTDSRRARARLALLLMAVTFLLVVALRPAPSQAAELTNYCGGKLPGNGWCMGEPRTFIALEGWGTEHAVCIWFLSGGFESISKCSGGANKIVYWATGDQYGNPGIRNAGGTSNWVQGVAWKP